MKYPLSHSLGKTLSEKFEEILRFHIPPSPDKTILDPTCGKRYLWESLFNGLENTKQLDLEGNRITLPWKVIFSDIQDFGYNKVCDVKDLTVEAPVDGIVYDPPYFFGDKEALETDERREDYGSYKQSYEELLGFMDIANEKFPMLLKDGGKLILKCADQHYLGTNMFYPLHVTWIERLTNFKIVDFFVCPHHNMSPTAYVIKNRPCAIIMHTYFIVFEKGKKAE